jgi:hypothetical protein
MSDEPTKRSRAWIGSVTLCLLSLGYPLSVGPATRYALRSADPLASAETVNKIYAPIMWITERSEWAEKACRWYSALWAPELNGL